MNGEALRIGVDFGGTKIAAVALDPAGAEVARCRAVTPHGDYEASVRAIRDLARAMGEEQGAATLGVGIPGSIDRVSGLVRNANSVWLNGRALSVDLAAAMGGPAAIENDANCFALSEATDGAGMGAEVVFGVILGTGVGGGAVVHGRLLRGANGVTGEWGHNPLPALRDDERPGPPCHCGRRGCIEQWVSGPALSADFARAVEASPQYAPTAREIVDLADADDPDAQAALARYLERLGRALAGVVNILDPDVIVLGGGLSNLPNIVESLPEVIAPHVIDDRVETRIIAARFGDASGVRGAAWLGAAGLDEIGRG